MELVGVVRGDIIQPGGKMGVEGEISLFEQKEGTESEENLGEREISNLQL